MFLVLTISSLETLYEEISYAKTYQADQGRGDGTAQVEWFCDGLENHKGISKAYLGNKHFECFKGHGSIMPQNQRTHFVIEKKKEGHGKGITHHLRGCNHSYLIYSEDEREQETGEELKTGYGKHGDESTNTHTGSNPARRAINAGYGDEFLPEPSPQSFHLSNHTSHLRECLL
jgi:hypothetical protein